MLKTLTSALLMSVICVVGCWKIESSSSMKTPGKVISIKVVPTHSDIDFVPMFQPDGSVSWMIMPTTVSTRYIASLSMLDGVSVECEGNDGSLAHKICSEFKVGDDVVSTYHEVNRVKRDGKEKKFLRYEIESVSRP